MDCCKGPDNPSSNEEKITQLIQKYQIPLKRMCCVWLKDAALAEDATQETFLKVYRGLDAFRGESSEKTWILTIAMHVCYDINHSAWFRWINLRVTPETLPERSAPATEGDDALAAAVMQLPRKLREVILLRYYEQLGVNEIAKALHISHSSVSGRLKRGRERLKKALEGRELDE